MDIALEPSGRTHKVRPSTRPTFEPMFRFRKYWCPKVTKVGYREMD